MSTTRSGLFAAALLAVASPPSIVVAKPGTSAKPSAKPSGTPKKKDDDDVGRGETCTSPETPQPIQEATGQ